jgi:hypothetical protein
MLPESAEPLGEGLADTLGEAPGVFPDPARGTPTPSRAVWRAISTWLDPDLMLR